jgi:hypothetical protein
VFLLGDKGVGEEEGDPKDEGGLVFLLRGEEGEGEEAKDRGEVGIRSAWLLLGGVVDLERHSRSTLGGTGRIMYSNTFNITSEASCGVIWVS